MGTDWKEFDAFVSTELAPDLKIMRPLGRGSVSSVYLAHEAALARNVAVKVVSPKYARDETTRRLAPQDPVPLAVGQEIGRVRLTAHELAYAERAVELRDRVPDPRTCRPATRRRR